MLSDFVKNEILTVYEANIIWDEWDETIREWRSSEPDTSQRITTFWKDIGHDFDGEPMIILAYYQPGSFNVSRDDDNFHQFMLDDDEKYLFYNGVNLSKKDVEEKITSIISRAVEQWEGIQDHTNKIKVLE